MEAIYKSLYKIANYTGSHIEKGSIGSLYISVYTGTYLERRYIEKHFLRSSFCFLLKRLRKGVDLLKNSVILAFIERATLPNSKPERHKMKKSKQAYFNTLNEALESENLVELWVLGSNIAYGETVQHIVEIGFTGKHKLISVYRENQGGRYERPVHYFTD